MAGITVSIDMQSLQGRINDLSQRLSNLQPMFAGIGEAVVSETVQRFRDSQAPDGSTWQPSARTQSGGKTLIDRGHLRDSITYRATATGAQVGTNQVYAAIHQFGGQTRPHEIRPRAAKALKFGNVFAKKVNHPGSTIPARPFLGVGRREEAAIRDQIETHLGFS